MPRNASAVWLTFPGVTTHERTASRQVSREGAGYCGLEVPGPVAPEGAVAVELEWPMVVGCRVNGMWGRPDAAAH